MTQDNIFFQYYVKSVDGYIDSSGNIVEADRWKTYLYRIGNYSQVWGMLGCEKSSDKLMIAQYNDTDMTATSYIDGKPGIDGVSEYTYDINSDGDFIAISNNYDVEPNPAIDSDEPRSEYDSTLPYAYKLKYDEA